MKRGRVCMDAKGEKGQYVMIYKPDPFPLPAGSGSARSRTLVFLPPTAISVVSSSTNLTGPLDIGLPCGENFLHSVKARPPAARRPPAPRCGRSLRSRPRLRVRPVANTRWMTKVVQVPGDAVAVLEQLQNDVGLVGPCVSSRARPAGETGEHVRRRTDRLSPAGGVRRPD